MNKENLQKMADYIRTIPEEKFDMRDYRSFDDKFSTECDSVACVIGHCTVLDKENILENFIKSSGNICFTEWSYDFTGIMSNEWYWCFSSYWTDTDNTVEGAARRIEWLINNGLPEDWEKQMHREEKLCY